VVPLIEWGVVLALGLALAGASVIERAVIA
jgi:hypothetical protein